MQSGSNGALRQTGAVIALVACLVFCGCGDDPAPQTQQSPDAATENAASDGAVSEGVAAQQTDDPVSNEAIAQQSADAEGSGDGNNLASSSEGHSPGDAPTEPDEVAIPPAPPFDLDQASERFLFFTPRGPLIVELVIAIDGAPYKSVTDGLIDRLLETADGAPLTWEQGLYDVRFLGLRMNQPPAEDMDLEAQIAQWDANTNGTVEADEVRAYIGGPMNAANADQDAVGATLTNDESATRSVLDRWWRVMDTDRNGRLAPEEAAAVRNTLVQYDTDDDEVVYLRDVLPSQLSGNTRRETPPMLAQHLTELTNWNSVSYQFDERYLHEGELSAASFPLDPDLFGLLDLNGDEFLRNSEIARLAEIAPHLIINVNFGTSPHREPGLVVLSSLSQVTPNPQEKSSNRARFDISGARLMFRSADAGGSESTQRAAEQFIRRLDANGDGYLDAEEASGSPLSTGERFSILDADDNEMLVADELLTALTWSQAARLTDVTIGIRSEEHSAFTALDTNGDGRLTSREQQSAEQNLMALDTNADGIVRYSELPSTIAVEIRRADGSATDESGDAGPSWFTSMDTNDDGDISRREFLGSDEQFEMLDANEDGLIDQREAEAAVDF